MAGRASVFSHPEIIQLLSESFVPVADDCGYTQTQQDAKGEFFRLWREEHIQRAELTLIVEAVTPEQVRFHIAGEFKNEAAPTFDVNPFSGQVADKPRGVDLKLIGDARFDRRQGRFTTFDAAAAGPRWGATTYNARFDDIGPAPIGFAFEVASGDPIERVPPAAIGAGYFA